MKNGIILTSLFAIITFATAANAQHVKVIDGTRLGASHVKVFNSTDTILLSRATVEVSIPAGKTIRFKPGKDTIKDSALIASFYAFDSAYSSPCGEAGGKTTGVSTAQLTLTGTINDPIYHWETDPAWKGTCRVLTVKFRGGGQARARVRFK